MVLAGAPAEAGAEEEGGREEASGTRKATGLGANNDLFNGIGMAFQLLGSMGDASKVTQAERSARTRYARSMPPLGPLPRLSRAIP